MATPFTATVGNNVYTVAVNLVVSAPDTTLTVTTATTILVANPNRADTLITNTGDQTLWFNRGSNATPTVGYGTPLVPGDTYSIDATNLYQGVIYGIAEGSGTTVNISEGQGN